jgi:hypothetical protein
MSAATEKLGQTPRESVALDYEYNAESESYPLVSQRVVIFIA